MRKAGIMPDTLNIVASIENPEAIKRSVKSGLGITIISKLAAEEEIRTGQVLEFPLQKDESSRYLNLVYIKLSAACSSRASDPDCKGFLSRCTYGEMKRGSI